MTSNIQKVQHLIALFIFTSTALVSSILAIILAFNPITLPFVIIYFVKVYFDKDYINGGRPKNLIKSSFYCKWLTHYFQAKVIFDHKLDENQNYIFGYHPHGIIAFGIFANFASNYSTFYETLPNFKVSLPTLNMNFFFPIHREIFLALGFISANKQSIQNALHKGNSCVIAIGGASEALLANPDRADIILNNRFGFVKLALRTGTPLVPIYSFGENSLYTQIQLKPGSFLHNLQKIIKKLFSFSSPIIYGRGLTENSIGLLPRRVPIVSIVGKPIYVEKDENPSNEKILEVLEVYKKELLRIYDLNKQKYGCTFDSKSPELEFH